MGVNWKENMERGTSTGDEAQKNQFMKLFQSIQPHDEKRKKQACRIVFCLFPPLHHPHPPFSPFWVHKRKKIGHRFLSVLIGEKQCSGQHRLRFVNMFLRKLRNWYLWTDKCYCGKNENLFTWKHENQFRPVQSIFSSHRCRFWLFLIIRP